MLNTILYLHNPQRNIEDHLYCWLITHITCWLINRIFIVSLTFLLVVLLKLEHTVIVLVQYVSIKWHLPWLPSSGGPALIKCTSRCWKCKALRYHATLEPPGLDKIQCCLCALAYLHKQCKLIFFDAFNKILVS